MPTYMQKDCVIPILVMNRILSLLIIHTRPHAAVTYFSHQLYLT
jgi:hypothetical protein